VQTEIRAGHLGIMRKSDDFMATDLAVRVLGGGAAIASSGSCARSAASRTGRQPV